MFFEIAMKFIQDLALNSLGNSPKLLNWPTSKAQRPVNDLSHDLTHRTAVLNWFPKEKRWKQTLCSEF